MRLSPEEAFRFAQKQELHFTSFGQMPKMRQFKGA
jgi:hypothetical protein